MRHAQEYFKEGKSVILTLEDQGKTVVDIRNNEIVRYVNFSAEHFANLIDVSVTWENRQ